jgi:hypothetical protein
MIIRHGDKSKKKTIFWFANLEQPLEKDRRSRGKKCAHPPRTTKKKQLPSGIDW